MLENDWNALKICLFEQPVNQPLSNFESREKQRKNRESRENFEGWGLRLDPVESDLSCLY